MSHEHQRPFESDRSQSFGCRSLVFGLVGQPEEDARVELAIGQEERIDLGEPGLGEMLQPNPGVEETDQRLAVDERLDRRCDEPLR